MRVEFCPAPPAMYSTSALAASSCAVRLELVSFHDLHRSGEAARTPAPRSDAYREHRSVLVFSQDLVGGLELRGARGGSGIDREQPLGFLGLSFDAMS